MNLGRVYANLQYDKKHAPHFTFNCTVISKFY